MLRGMSAIQFQEWRAYADLEPFDEARADLRAGSIVQAFLNVHRRKGQPQIKLQDCTLRFGITGEQPKTPEQARAEISQAMDFLCLIFNSPQEPESPRRKAKR